MDNGLVDFCILAILLCHFLFEDRSGLEGRDIVGRDDHWGLLGDIAGCLGGAFLDDERAEATEIDILTLCEAVLDGVHEAFDYQYY